MTHNSSRGKHGVVREVVNHVELELVALQRRLQQTAVTDYKSEAHTVLAVIRGPGNPPLTTTAARSYPSGEMSALLMVRSAVGPTAAAARRVLERPRATNVTNEANLLMMRIA